MTNGMTDGMTDNDVDRPEPPSAKAVTALLEARSLSRRADKLGGVAATVDDPTTQQLDNRRVHQHGAAGAPSDGARTSGAARREGGRSSSSISSPRPRPRTGVRSLTFSPPVSTNAPLPTRPGPETCPARQAAGSSRSRPPTTQPASLMVTVPRERWMTGCPSRKSAHRGGCRARGPRTPIVHQRSRSGGAAPRSTHGRDRGLSLQPFLALEDDVENRGENDDDQH